MIKKFCVDCKHCRIERTGGHFCENPKVVPVSMITGEARPLTCYDARYNGDCGARADFFEKGGAKR